MQKFIPVVVIKELGETDKILTALKKSGIMCAEITFRTACAAEAIAYAVKHYPDMEIGAGTVINAAQCEAALQAGATFIVTPGFDPDLVAYCQEKGLPIYPGCTTPTDYHAALKFGLKVLKFFPAEQSGGLAKIKAMSAPFPMFKVMPTGGISLKNLKEYISAPVICACGGSYMVTADLIENGKWDEITELCLKSAAIVKEARNG